MPDSRDERRDGPNRATGRDGYPVTAGELLGIVVFWAFLGALTAAGRLLDPRIPLRPEISSALISLSFIEYAIWAALTIPIVWVANRLSGAADAQHRALRIALIVALGLVVAVGVDAVLVAFRLRLLPPPPGATTAGFGGILRFEFIPALMV